MKKAYWAGAERQKRVKNTECSRRGEGMGRRSSQNILSQRMGQQVGGMIPPQKMALLPGRVTARCTADKARNYNIILLSWTEFYNGKTRFANLAVSSVDEWRQKKKIKERTPRINARRKQNRNISNKKLLAETRRTKGRHKNERSCFF